MAPLTRSSPFPTSLKRLGVELPPIQRPILNGRAGPYLSRHRIAPDVLSTVEKFRKSRQPAAKETPLRKGGSRAPKTRTPAGSGQAFPNRSIA